MPRPRQDDKEGGGGLERRWEERSGSGPPRGTYALPLALRARVGGLPPLLVPGVMAARATGHNAPRHSRT